MNLEAFNLFGGPAGAALLRRLGKATFAFFLIKGLLWLAAPFVFLWIV